MTGGVADGTGGFRPVIIRIDSELAAWDALNGLVSGRLKAKDVTLDLSDLNWTKVRLAYRGPSFEQSITASMMAGVIEFQNDVYRSVARLLKNDGRITRLTDAEKRQFELVFSVEDGSTELLAKAADSLGALGAAVEKLNGRQALIAIIVFLLLLFTAFGGYTYLGHIETMQKIEAEQKGREFDKEEKKELYEFIERMLKDKGAQAATLRKAAQISPPAGDVMQYSDHAVAELLRQSGDADEVVYQGIEFPSHVIEAVTSTRRAKSEKITIKETFFVRGIESDDPTKFQVHLANADDTLIITAELEDPLVGARYQRAIQKAEWSHKPVFVHIVGRRVGENIRDAKIVRAYSPRKPA